MVSPNKTETKDWWDKTKIIAEILAIIAVIYYGNAINTSLKEREINLQLVQLAIEVLQTEPNNSTSALREWAVKVVDDLSGVPLGEQVKKELLKNPLPSKWSDKETWDDNKIWKD